jgi:hypothetical protein
LRAAQDRTLPAHSPVEGCTRQDTPGSLGGRGGGTAPSRCEWLPNSPGGAPPPPTVAIVLGNSAGSRGGGAPTRKPFQYQHNVGIGSASLPPLAWGSRWGNPSARLTCVYAVSQRDFSLEFRLRDALSRMISVIRDSHMHASHTLDSAMRLGEKAAPPRTPEQLAELGKYSGRSLQAG